MEYVAFAFGIMGLVAFLEVYDLKRKVNSLEAQLGKMEGTPQYEERVALIQAVGNYIGKQVRIDLKEDYQDVDISMYGNTKHGSNTILDVDDDWILVRVDSAKGTKELLIRTEAVQRISDVNE
ncbi:MAG: hypothetical protein J5795_03535 [Lachnospiraceae bacterium]|nr:hypothetical protein [Lachnospiraceae bacterium]